MKNNAVRVAGSLCLFFAVCCVTMYFSAVAPVPLDDSVFPVSVNIGRGQSARQIGAVLKKSGLIRSETAFYLYVRQTHTVIRAGRYSVPAKMPLPELVRFLQYARPDFQTATIPEGMTYQDMAELFEKKGIVPAAEFISACTDAELLKSYHIPAASFEGYLFPDTYHFDYDISATTVVRIMADTFFRQIADIPGFSDCDPRELHEKLIFASIVEREYRRPEEAPLIASVFYNRHKVNMGLGSCATIEYIITDILHRPHPDVITYDDLQIDSPYNTYKWAALPPGPISNPGRVALRAAGTPADTPYYYFRLVDPATGRHAFSETFSQHSSRNLVPKKAAGN